MTAEIIILPTVRAEREEKPDPHLSGDAICTTCGNQWVAVAPVGTVHLTCPKCDRLQGVFKNAVEPEEAWACNCGERLFWLTRHGSMCRTCGTISSDWADA